MDQNEFINFVEHKYTKTEKALFLPIEEYIENQFNVSIYKIRNIFNQITNIFEIFLQTNAEKKIIFQNLHNKIKFQNSVQDFIKKIIKENKLQKHFHADVPIVISFFTFEAEALEYCYHSSLTNYNQFQKKYFNPQTMSRIDPMIFYVTYKTKDFMKQAKESGEQKYLRNEYYHFIKQYDRFNMITPDRHLFAFFDYERGLSGRFYYDLYLELLGDNLSEMTRYNLVGREQWELEHPDWDGSFDSLSQL